jgi:hypothetical protein
MPTSRLFAYNTGSLISGTTQVGSIAISESPSLNYSQGVGGVRWWNGPNEDLGYVITHTTPSGTQPNRDNVPAYIGFWRSPLKTENSLITFTNNLFGTSHTTGDQCKTWLNANGYWTSWGGSSFDSDAQAFITAAGITDNTQQTAINTLVVGLKADSVWSKIGIIYPFVGGNATSHRYNLKSADSYLLTFYGDWTHGSTGAQPNGINAYASTGYLDSAYGVNIHRAVYSRQNIEGTGMDLAVSNTYIYGESGGGGANLFNIGSTTFFTQLGDSYSVANHTTTPNTLGLFVSSRTGAGSLGLDISGYRNGTLLSTVNTNSGYGIGSNFTTGKPIYLSAQYYYVDEDGTPIEFIGEYSNRQQSFVSYGEGLTSAEVANLYTRVQAFQTTLSRSV